MCVRTAVQFEKFRIEIVYGDYAYRQGNAVIVFSLNVKWLALFLVWAVFFFSLNLILSVAHPSPFDHFRSVSRVNCE